jgi:hypothetical protein
MRRETTGNKFPQTHTRRTDFISQLNPKLCRHEIIFIALASHFFVVLLCFCCCFSSCLEVYSPDRQIFLFFLLFLAEFFWKEMRSFFNDQFGRIYESFWNVFTFRNLNSIFRINNNFQKLECKLNLKTLSSWNLQVNHLIAPPNLHTSHNSNLISVPHIMYSWWSKL